MSVELYVPKDIVAVLLAWKRRWSRKGEEIVRGKLPTKDIVFSQWDYEKLFSKGLEF